MYFVSNAQKQLGVGISTRISGNGFGATYSFKLMYKNNRSLFGISPLIQKQNFNLYGMQVSYEYTFFGDNISHKKNRLELFCFLNTSYNNGIQKKLQLKTEGVNNDNARINTNGKLKTIENYGGFGLRIKMSNNFLWTNSIGFGDVYTINHCCFKNIEQNYTVIMLRTGLIYRFSINKNNRYNYKYKQGETIVVTLM